MMKTDREFLDGIYEKAKIYELNNQLENSVGENISSKVINLKPRKSIGIRATAAVAAAIMLIAIPSVIYINEPKMETPKGYEDNAPMAIRAMLAPPDVQTLADNSDIILTGKITKIEKSVYEEDNSGIITSVKLRPIEVFKGDIAQTTLNIKVSGGFIKKTESFQPYEAVFERAEEVLLFLKLDGDITSDEAVDENLYILSDGELSKYSRRDSSSGEQSYVGKDDTTISISEIKEVVKGE